MSTVSGRWVGLWILAVAGASGSDLGERATTGPADWFVFRDLTSGVSTYAGGRFLRVPKPAAEGHLAVDFNRAYNPPCAFTPFATCPLPLPQNALPFAVTAGERNAHHVE